MIRIQFLFNLFIFFTFKNMVQKMHSLIMNTRQIQHHWPIWPNKNRKNSKIPIFLWRYWTLQRSPFKKIKCISITNNLIMIEKKKKQPWNPKSYLKKILYFVVLLKNFFFFIFIKIFNKKKNSFCLKQKKNSSASSNLSIAIKSHPLEYDLK